MKDIPDNAIINLVAAIINRAALDYAIALRKGDAHGHSRKELENFFNGQMFALATDDYPPDLFMKKIERGECFSVNKQTNRREGQLRRYRLSV